MSAPTASPTATWTSAAVTGDGTTLGSRSRRRWRTARWLVGGVGALLVAVLALALLRPVGSVVPYDPGNTRPNGSQALARVLERQGVQVQHVTHVADAVDAAVAGSTLLVVPAPYLLPEQVTALAGVDADLVLAGADDGLLRAATGDQVRRASWGSLPTSPVDPGCDLPAAVAAGPSLLEPGLEPTSPTVATCWSGPDGSAALAATERDGRQVVAVDDPAFLRNDDVLTEGNAALALHLLGSHDRLVWLVPDPADSTVPGDPTAEPETGAVLPDWFDAALWWAVLVALVTAVWRSRRLGGLVTERLPVVVPSAESTRGRARLYRRARSRGHAAAGLRAATAQAVARRLGLARSAHPDTLVDAVVRATGRDPREVADLIYGPPPADDAALSELARRLDTLESEVHRP
ncbi:DUF4350 domain-containing protein [Isoptericola sp. S6320L]|uniref:DUF4350 domain-containing protein n=1 Tax=Isoptericola sp. S6320L TaxID=2926411 RepID=UPI001FF5A257|nr:DUF4350 domain-containing protein [Isoptericola sp. S6320L]MCK0118700.1 DUF4350 domain-containing protein [Isoptericola sp. S6320L]